MVEGVKGSQVGESIAKLQAAVYDELSKTISQDADKTQEHVEVTSIQFKMAE